LSIYRIHVLSGAAWSSVLHVWLIMQRSWVWAHQRPLVVSLH